MWKLPLISAEFYHNTSGKKIKKELCCMFTDICNCVCHNWQAVNFCIVIYTSFFRLRDKMVYDNMIRIYFFNINTALMSFSVTIELKKNKSKLLQCIFLLSRSHHYTVRFFNVHDTKALLSLRIHFR